MKDLREVSYILGIEIYRDKSERLLRLSQSIYIDTMLKRFNIDNFKKWYLLISQEFFLSKKDFLTTSEERVWMSRIPYASAVGSIMYAMTCTRSDVAYSLSVKVDINLIQVRIIKKWWRSFLSIWKILKTIG